MKPLQKFPNLQYMSAQQVFFETIVYSKHTIYPFYMEGGFHLY